VSSLVQLQKSLNRSRSLAGDRGDPFIDSGITQRFLLAGIDAHGVKDREWQELPGRILSAALPEVDIPPPDELQSERLRIKTLLEHRSYDLVMIAAHGYYDSLDPMGSGLILRRGSGLSDRPVSVLGERADRQGIPYNFPDLPVRQPALKLPTALNGELLSVAELAQHGHVECPLVALLGCSSGRAVVAPGDHPMSMADMFLKIGAGAVLAPMWDITLTACEAWMTRYLRHWSSGRARGEAARAAASDGVNDGEPLHHIGAMALHGDWS